MDFVEAQALWRDEALAETPARSDTEERFLVVGCIAGKHWSAFITYRGEAVRLISDAALGPRRWQSMKASELDKRFDDCEDITSELDLTKVRRPNREQRRVNVDLPTWMIDSLDREARRLGVTRQSIIKVWIAERLEQKAS